MRVEEKGKGGRDMRNHWVVRLKITLKNRIDETKLG